MAVSGAEVVRMGIHMLEDMLFTESRNYPIIFSEPLGY
jgi:hypothetical protein